MGFNQCRLYTRHCLSNKLGSTIAGEAVTVEPPGGVQADLSVVPVVQRGATILQSLWLVSGTVTTSRRGCGGHNVSSPPGANCRSECRSSFTIRLWSLNPTPCLCVTIMHCRCTSKPFVPPCVFQPRLNAQSMHFESP